MTEKQRIRVWDLPIRIFHWSLALLVGAAVISGKIGGNAIDWHGRIGLAILGLLAFRIVWGVAGSTYARFAHFAPTPSSLRTYFRGEWHRAGHNPLGALSVFTLLALLSAQVISGLLSSDDIAFSGYLANLVDKTLSDRLTAAHKLLADLCIALILLHIAAIAFHVRVRKDNLLKPMLTGWRDDAPHDSASTRGGGAVAIVCALLVAAGAVYGGSGAWLPAPPPHSAPATPDW